MQSLPRSAQLGQAGPCCSRPIVRIPKCFRLQHRAHTALPLPHPPAASAAFDASSGDSGAAQTRPDGDYKPFPRLGERDPYRLLGLGKDAAFEEVQDARNYLYELYRWHEPSREAIELAFDRITQEKLKARHKYGFRPVRMGKRGDVVGEAKATWEKKVNDLIDPTITSRTLINEGSVFAVLALWATFATDQSFPLAAAFAYSVYKFQNKRVKRDPEGPFFGGNPIVGAILTTVIVLGTCCGLLALLTTPLQALLGPSMRQASTFLVIMALGLANVYLK
ncbi:hypothetical protein HYH02_002767 [Chlamydomonas schloesseri]|uniref:Uncharacterized protein n=1 Tax=Chlamydomonas schloesseri TaxID=2026947 RepID=A0A836BB17_9CHLO|nr:hypothetical protein HYH02_002767 [Chlamydomonas schloesseri]|eukprot:KAG2452529.1 hypothetical protein HYH02_002767 [Chlamydomonas schloesseri]